MSYFEYKVPVNLKKLSDTAITPTYGTEEAACCDLYADIKSIPEAEDFKLYISPGGTIKVPTGIAIQPPEGWCALIYARSGISTKKGLRPANCVGVIDRDYTGNIIVALHNDSDEMQVIEHGDRIAQMKFVHYDQADFTVVENLDKTNRGSGGFGHTGK